MRCCTLTLLGQSRGCWLCSCLLAAGSHSTPGILLAYFKIHRRQGDHQQSFTEGTSHLANLMVFYGRVAALVEKGRATVPSVLTCALPLVQSHRTSLSLNWIDRDLMDTLFGG